MRSGSRSPLRDSARHQCPPRRDQTVQSAAGQPDTQLPQPPVIALVTPSKLLQLSVAPTEKADTCNRNQRLEYRAIGFKVTQCDCLFAGGAMLGPVQNTYSVRWADECGAYCRKTKGCEAISYDTQAKGEWHACKLFGSRPPSAWRRDGFRRRDLSPEIPCHAGQQHDDRVARQPLSTSEPNRQPASCRRRSRTVERSRPSVARG